jgi:hypothetical protein
MQSLESISHSFIVRVWREEPDTTAAAWRGEITHVPDGRRRRLEGLGDVREFIAPYLAELGVDAGPGGRLRRWFRRWRR